MLKCSFVLLKITETELTKVVRSFKSKISAGLDGISPYSVKKYVHYRLWPLLQLESASIRDGIFSSTFKKSVAKPV
jgi:hypothetical protein